MMVVALLFITILLCGLLLLVSILVAYELYRLDKKVMMGGNSPFCNTVPPPWCHYCLAIRLYYATGSVLDLRMLCGKVARQIEYYL